MQFLFYLFPIFLENHNADHENGNFNLYIPSFTGHRISNDAYTYISSVHTVLDSEKGRRRKCSG